MPKLTKKRKAQLVRIFHSVLEEWRVHLREVKSLKYVDGFILVKDEMGTVRNIPDADKEMFDTLISQEPIKGTVQEFDENGEVDRFA